jgi:hypothetical protein
MNFRQFVTAGILPGDKGNRVIITPLVEAFLQAWESDAQTLVIVTPRRCGKSTIVGQFLAWSLLCRPMSYVVCCAGSLDQCAAVVHQKIRVPLQLHAKLRDRFSFARDGITCAGMQSSCTVIPSSDVTAPGRTCDLFIEEAASVPESGYEILRPAAASGRIIVCGTPGNPSSWFHRLVHEPDSSTRVIQFNDPEACGNPHLDMEFVRRERLRLSKRGAYGNLLAERLWSAAWVSLAEHPMLTPDQVRACVRPAGGVEPYDARHDVCYTAADMSISRHLCSIATIARRGDSLRLVDLWVLDPADHGGIVPFNVVEQRVTLTARRFNPERILVDRFQFAASAQRLREAGVRVVDVQVSTTLNAEAFTALSDAIGERRLVFESHARLEQELMNLELVEGANSIAKVVDADKRLHRDCSWSLAVAVLEAVRGHYEPPGRPFGVFEGPAPRWRECGPQRFPRWGEEDVGDPDEVFGDDWRIFPRKPAPTPEEVDRRLLREAEERYERARRALAVEGAHGEGSVGR